MIEDKVSKLLAAKAEVISCILVPKTRGAQTGKASVEILRLGVPFQNSRDVGEALHFDVISGAVHILLDKVFSLPFYEHFSFHLGQDEDDTPTIAKPQAKKRARLVKTSEVFIPPNHEENLIHEKPKPVITETTSIPQEEVPNPTSNNKIEIKPASEKPKDQSKATEGGKRKRLQEG